MDIPSAHYAQGSGGAVAHPARKAMLPFLLRGLHYQYFLSLSAQTHLVEPCIAPIGLPSSD